MVLAVSASLLALPLLAASPAATSTAAAAAPDPKPGIGQEWPRCGTGADTDGFYCVESVTRNGVEVYDPDLSVEGPFEDPYIDLIGPGDVRFGVYNWVVVGGVLQQGDPWGDLDPTATWVWTVNTGPIDTLELYAHVRDPDLSFGGNATDGYTFTLTVMPAPIAWAWGVLGTDGCSFSGGCGDNSTVAGLMYRGFITGYVTDDATSGLPPGDLSYRRGFINSGNAEDVNVFYDWETNSMVVQMANVHLAAPGVPATGYFETVIPDSMLIREYGVPDPTSLTSASFMVHQSGSTATVPFTVTRETDGIRLKISGITFSRPEFRIKPKASVPGKPRWGAVTRPDRRTVKVIFRRPVADGGKAITTYRVQCGRGVNVWTTKVHRVTPALFPDMPRKAVTCKMRAVNSVGAGPWSSVKQG